MYRLLGTVLILTLGVSWADTLTLRNGRTISGSYLGGDSRQIRMAVGDKIETYSIADVSKLEFGSLSAPPTSIQSSNEVPAAAAPDRRALQTRESSTGSTQPGRGIEIPAGTTLTIRMIDPVDSRTDRVGQTYHASLDEPIMVNGDVVIQRNADVIVKLVDDQESGRLTGKTVLTLDLESITVDGRVIPLATEEVSRASGSRTKRTGLAAGGLAALGAIIGGIAGGGKGAAIGAVTGAGAGAATSVIMKGERVNVPSETRLTFTLQQPLRI
jgi:hypothetical protein